MKRLITAFEVIEFAPVAHNYDPRQVSLFVTDAELELCSNCCFSENFYLDLIDKLKTAEEFNGCKSYLIGDVVVYGSKFYEAIQDTTDEKPTNTAFWTVTEKFTLASYNELWKNHLAEFLSLSVIHASVISSAYKLETVGVMRNSTDFSDSAKDAGVMALKNDLQNRKEARFEAMHKYLTRVNEALGIDNVTKYPLYPPNEVCCGDSLCDKRSKRDTVNIPFVRRKKRVYSQHDQTDHHHHSKDCHCDSC